MGRPRRAAQGGLVYHTLNRANARLTIFEDEGDFIAFERILAEAVTRYGMRLLAYCVLPNHFHLLLWPRGDGDLSQFMQWLTLTHTQRWHAHHQSAGSGHLYQGRFKSFPVQSDDHFLAVCRYVERNARASWLGGAGGGLAMGELGAMPYHRRGFDAEAVSLADRQAAGLDTPRQHADDPGGRRVRASQHPQRSTLWHGTLAKAYGLTTGPGVDVSTTRPPHQDTK